MAVLVVVGIATTLLATEPEKSAAAEAEHARMPAKAAHARVRRRRVGAFADFLLRDMAIVVLAFVVLFKFTDALAGAMTAPS